MIRILPSLASADILRLKDEIDSIPDSEYLHIDIEDGNFIPNITFGMNVVNAVSEYSAKKLDIHMMVTNPEPYIEWMIKNERIDSITFQVEATQYPEYLLQRIREAGKKAGIAFNMQTPPDIAAIYRDALDSVLIMTSEPDGKNCSFKPLMIEKVRQIKHILPNNVRVQVDGGISINTIAPLVSAGADLIVLGRAIWKGGFPNDNYRKIVEYANGIKEGH